MKRRLGDRRRSDCLREVLAPAGTPTASSRFLVSTLNLTRAALVFVAVLVHSLSRWLPVPPIGPLGRTCLNVQYLSPGAQEFRMRDLQKETLGDTDVHN